MTSPAPQPWTFTLLDAVTRTELAVLPLTKAKYSRQVSGAGRFDGYLTLTNPRVRALNPWAAMQPRRTVLAVEYGNRCVWSGPVIGRPRGSGSPGMQVTAITWEGWLARQRLITDLAVTGTTLDVVKGIVNAAQATTSVGLTAAATTPVVNRYLSWAAAAVKPLDQLLGDLVTQPGYPKIEWRVDTARDANGVFQPVLVIGEPRIGRAFADTQLSWQYPNGPLTAWQQPEDGSAASNLMVLLGSGSGPTQPFNLLRDSDAGIGELASGYPTWMTDFRSSDTGDLGLVASRAAIAMRAGVVGEQSLFTGVTVRAVNYLADAPTVGDDVALEIVHESMQEWPASVQFITRLLGESVTIGDGGKPDQVGLTVGGTP